MRKGLLTGGAFPQGGAIMNNNIPYRKKPNGFTKRPSAAYKKIRLTSQDSGTLHMSIFEQPCEMSKANNGEIKGRGL